MRHDVLHQFHSFVRMDPSFAQAVLDTCADNSRRFLLTGSRFVVLVQTDDPRIANPPLQSDGRVGL